MAKPEKNRDEDSAKLFHFKRFSVRQQDAAMKIGFDGVLLGAWCSVEGYKRILDVGTGTGLIALMVAQRTERSDGMQIDAIEVDSGAAREAQYNFECSPWRERLRVVHEAFQTWYPRSTEPCDLIVCNPPYFTSHCSPSPRGVARQATVLSSISLLKAADSILAPRGQLCLIAPFGQRNEIVDRARQLGLFKRRALAVRPIPTKEPHRVLLEFGASPTSCDDEEIVIEQSRHAYTPGFRRLTRGFYMKF